MSDSRSCRALAFALCLGAPAVAFAHGDHVPTLATAWTLSPWFLLPASVLLGLYTVGLARLWRQAGIARGVSWLQAGGFGAGILALFLAAVWPLDAYGEWSLAAHMAQHMLLLALAPPLLLSGRPMGVVAHALPPRWSPRVHRAVAGLKSRVVAGLGWATLVHVGVMALWHLPAATGAALASDGVHWAMHGSFLLAGLWFWTAMLHRLRDASTGAGPALLAVVAVMMAMGFMGALLTFSRRPLYDVYAERAPALGLDVLADQQLAGLVMWVPACLPYLIGGLWLMLAWMQRAQRRQDRPPGGASASLAPRTPGPQA